MCRYANSEEVYLQWVNTIMHLSVQQPSHLEVVTVVKSSALLKNVRKRGTKGPAYTKEMTKGDMRKKFQNRVYLLRSSGVIPSLSLSELKDSDLTLRKI